MIIEKTYMGVYGIIVNEGKIVLIKKARGGYKGKLDLPGGGIEYKENPTDTLKREIMEEVGIEIDDYILLDVVSNNIKWKMDIDTYEDLHHIGVLYTVKISDYNLKKDADGLDSNGADWYNISDLSKENLSPFTIMGLEKLGYKLK